MNNLKTIYRNKPEVYKEELMKLIAELKAYSDSLEKLYTERNYIELKLASHTIRNLASAIGQSKLKILAAYWEDMCAQNKVGDVNEFKQTIQEAVVNIEKEEV